MQDRQFYSTPAWRRIRLAVLRRDNYTCQVQGKGCTQVATQAHHVLGREVAPYDITVIIASCRKCNRAIGKPQGDPDPRPML